MSLEESAIIIQKAWRKYKFSKLDGITTKDLEELIDAYISLNKKYKEINKKLVKKIRRVNLPENISEKIVQLALYHKYGFYTTTQKSGGDIFIGNIKLEVKGFISNGPTSFGPTEKWERIYFVDAKNIEEKMVKIYEFKYSNDSPEWINIKMNSKETYGEQCIQGRRPRIKFDEIKYIPHQCIFDGKICDLSLPRSDLKLNKIAILMDAKENGVKVIPKKKMEKRKGGKNTPSETKQIRKRKVKYTRSFIKTLGDDEVRELAKSLGKEDVNMYIQKKGKSIASLRNWIYDKQFVKD
jgi:hypothetical protein